MAFRKRGFESPTVLYSLSLTLVVMSFMINEATSSEVLREADVFPECQFVSKCNENEAELEMGNFTVINSTMGTVNIYLKDLKENYETLLTVMTVTIQEGKQGCENGSDFPYLNYSCKVPDSNKLLNCSYQEVILNYLTTGCYNIYNEQGKVLGQYPIETNYSLQDLEEECSFRIKSNLVLEKYTRIWMRLKQYHMNNVLKLYLIEKSCRNPRETDFWWKVELKEHLFEDIIIERNVPENTSVNCAVIRTELGYDELHCEIDWEDPSCLIIKREKSNYPTNYREICPDVSYIDLGPVSPMKKVVYITPIVHFTATTSVLFIILIPLMVIGMFFGMKLYFSDPDDYTQVDKGILNSTFTPGMKYKILLLYPQDCEMFMITMKYLKEVLESYNYFEVYDCFDPRRMDEIAHDPQGWISKLLSQRDVRVVVSETDTAVFHQVAVREKCLVTYASPMAYNTLFTYGLQMLLQSIRPQEYNRIFLFRFDDIKQDQDKLHLAHYQRFKLPNHLSKLVCNLTKTDIVTFGEPEESTSLKRLKRSIEQYEQFRHNNPTYHLTLFNNLIKVV